ncbi:SMP-30/gluconolactonase/LRE family protein [Neptunicella sp. SCSIO 80796]|uniref:SMP-30/gluconolactonase/LRE family protein n=1 Tax=Neptunicella plasticusilytica TaxID=3117012 RepID=UPI003A4DA42A
MKIKLFSRLFLFAFGLMPVTFSYADTTKLQAQAFTKDGLFTKGIEGPAVDGDGRLYAVNFAKQGTIGIIDDKGQASHFIDLPEGSTGNGIRFGQDGSMFVADYTGHNILRIDPQSKAVDIYAHDDRMNQPNDIAITASGVIYASDPDWKNNSGQLWMVKADRKLVRLEADMGTTNGIEVSSDEKHLYVNESAQRNIWIYDILPNNQLANKRLFYQFEDHGMDGMRCDQQGNLYVARYGAGNVTVLSPQGEIIKEITLTGKFPTNVAFGGPQGKTLFITLQQKQSIDTVELDIAGRSRGLISELPAK